jgi:hypothetical protein
VALDLRDALRRFCPFHGCASLSHGSTARTGTHSLLMEDSIDTSTQWPRAFVLRSTPLVLPLARPRELVRDSVSRHSGLSSVKPRRDDTAGRSSGSKSRCAGLAQEADRSVEGRKIPPSSMHLHLPEGAPEVPNAAIWQVHVALQAHESGQGGSVA